MRRKRAPLPPLTLETKWGWMPCVEMGWCAVPSAFLRYAGALGITPEEGWLLLQLLDLKWTEGRSSLPHLIDRCRLSPEAIHQILRSLEERGFLKLIPKHHKVAANGRTSVPPGKNGTPNGNGNASNGSTPSPEPNTGTLSGWEIDLSPLLQALNEYVMRGGDLSAGFLRLSSVQIRKDRP
ncbi:MAG: hypothetical protein KY468_07635 [Armatimonadetes bacterium]|nr:hypothetical protein [Armatimonadota bacterium]